jgi:CMP-N,N'-diacetyllegionaminic acid synthase
MYKDFHILCIIPARGGSKRLPGKNIKLLNGKPLIAYAIEAASGSKYIDRTIVSTDDEAIASVAREYGAEVPFMRPEELSSDTATTLQALEHAVLYVEKDGQVFDLIVLIQPNVPGVLPADVDEVIEKLIHTQTNSCVSMCEISEHPEHMYKLDSKEHAIAFMESEVLRTQDMQKLYRINGAVYISRRAVHMDEHKIIDQAYLSAILMPRERSVDIDTEFDFILAEAALQKGHI